MGLKNYCIYCGKSFEPDNLQNIFCSDKCRITRYNERKRISNKKCRQKIKAELAKLKILENQLEKANKENARLQKELENAKQSTNMKYCERMKVKATSLPCGAREECWLNPKCEHNKLNEKPNFK